MNDGMQVEPTIGLEIHVQLNTSSKLFCRDANVYGAPPNTHVCPVCLGFPGALPVVNERAIELGIRAALALGSDVLERSGFARKNYFYPDLPKGYQITQFEEPLARGGELGVHTSGSSTTIRIRGLHLEEDSGKLLHDRLDAATAIDFNRAGVPLLEIVTEPDLRSAAEARSFLKTLKQLLEYLDVSACNMEQGHLRVDANISVRQVGVDRLGSRTEIKNLNSFGNVERALSFEIARQEAILAAGDVVNAETLLWDESARGTRGIRSKEQAADYRYFPEPDLPPLIVSGTTIDTMRENLPELPWVRHARFQRDYDLPATAASLLTRTRDTADYYEEVVERGAAPRTAANWMTGDLLAAVNACKSSFATFAVRPVEAAALLRMLDAGDIRRPLARTILSRMIETGRSAAELTEDTGLLDSLDEDATKELIDEILQTNPDAVRRYRAGEVRLEGHFVGQVMRRSGGRADPELVRTRLRRKLSE
ncbi:MAG TPA: Asp-tRNA(Asn)/Glu-tRNA(Gln) amidotransferase subunit GatB [Longimicrobiaceae bacterium]|nr:Asp-tRNA(Asn)/Glu-tRNA(Gln) amidotransferase subunit GatB [Longimicrobiaceae bacterium]